MVKLNCRQNRTPVVHSRKFMSFRKAAKKWIERRILLSIKYCNRAWHEWHKIRRVFYAEKTDLCSFFYKQTNKHGHHHCKRHSKNQQPFVKSFDILAKALQNVAKLHGIVSFCGTMQTIVFGVFVCLNLSKRERDREIERKKKIEIALEWQLQL